MSNSSPDIIIPVYLNQRLVFDIVAMLQGGIATVTRVSEAQREVDKASNAVTGGFGLSQALSSLLRVNISGKMADETESSVERNTAADRVHTPASLFYILRNLLFEKDVLHLDAADKVPNPGQFIEFTASLRRNPLIEGLDAVVEILDLATVLAEPEKPRGSGTKAVASSGLPNLKHLRTQLESISQSLKAGGTQDLVADGLQSGRRALLTVEEEFLNDRSLSDLVDGTFRVVGKVTRFVPDGQGSISLLRNTAMSRVPATMLQALITPFATLHQVHGFVMPAMEVEVKSPVFQVLPLAIFA